MFVNVRFLGHKTKINRSEKNMHSHELDKSQGFGLDFMCLFQGNLSPSVDYEMIYVNVV